MNDPVEITLLTAPDCGFCDHAKQVLGRLGRQYRLQVIEIDLTSEAGNALAADSGVMFAPGVLVAGEPFSFGRLSERKLRRALDRRAGADRM
ncbi:glutaredoxin family protein [Rhodococcus opacus]|uniref:glutaredoxin family protein n=1 Tax=Rhodococcus opacus TaxID=37919 RepID=UPI001C44D1F4|nr:glutaredoxin domain-containing protein [Rhodococcus opacus]MBV6761432.1 glutaredoxin family protein [Rhodococcus opacus]